MAKKCLVPNCSTNYRKTKRSPRIQEKSPVYRLPADPGEFANWMKSLPYKNLRTNKDSVICRKHWPATFNTVSKKGKLRPSEPPSLWPGVAQSSLPTPVPHPRPTKRSSLTIRGTQPDEMDQFTQEDNVIFGDIVDRVTTKRDLFCCSTKASTEDVCSTIAYMDNSCVYIQSTSFSGVPKFVIEIEETLKFKCFHMGIKVNIPCMVKKIEFRF